MFSAAPCSCSLQGGLCALAWCSCRAGLGTGGEQSQPCHCSLWWLRLTIRKAWCASTFSYFSLISESSITYKFNLSLNLVWDIQSLNLHAVRITKSSVVPQSVDSALWCKCCLLAHQRIQRVLCGICTKCLRVEQADREFSSSVAGPSTGKTQRNLKPLV